ncbi:MAG: glycosyltransferase family 2 protein [Silicimonas sp.]|nr:glycosyltransferase family 2 protein [Silicimonas sp.]
MSDDPKPLFISTMKNEGPYILEWLAYHRVIGFSQFLIYSNDCEDGTTDILDRLTALGLVQHEENFVLKRGPHKSALKYAREHPLTRMAEWIYVADIDEYLNIHLGDGTVQELIAVHPQADVIPVTWRLFSHNGHVELQRPYLLEDFTDAERPFDDGGQSGRFVKSLFRNDHRVERFGLHVPIFGEDHEGEIAWVSPDGRQISQAEDRSRPRSQFGYEAAQVNHYAVRSLDGYLVKRDRGRANHYRQTLGADYWRRMCRGGREDRSIQRHVPAVKAEMARMLQDETLAELHEASLDWHKSKIRELRSIDDFENLRNELLALSMAGDHQRKEETTPADNTGGVDLEALVRKARSEVLAEQVGDAADLVRDPNAMIAVLRQSLEGIQPLEANLAATGLVNELETIFKRSP